MKTIKVLTIATVITLIFSSCAHTLYSPEIMEYNYNMKMKSPEELTAKAQVRIFLSEKDVKGDYTIISINTYNPFTIPLIVNYKNKMSRRFYQRAVMKAQEQGGNGIIITSAGMYKVINITAWDADAEAPAQYVNAIFDATLMNKFIDGQVANAKKADVKRHESSLCDEIQWNIKEATNIDEVEFIKKKIATLKSYNASLKKPKSSLTKVVEKSEKTLLKVEKKIRKKMEKRK